MKKTLILITLFLIALPTFSQKKEKIKTWLEEFYQRSFEEEKIMHDEVKNRNKKYPELYPEFDLDYWFKLLEYKIINQIGGWYSSYNHF